MINKLLGVLGDSNEKALKKLWPLVEEVNDLEPEFEALSNDQLRTKTDEFRSRLNEGEEVDDILPEAFAAVREAAKRTLGQRHYDVQILGGVVLHQGKIAEMKTGEGKTLVATLPVYLNGLAGKGVHVVTVNDYLAKRDTQWMGPIYHLLGLSVACLQHDGSYAFDPEAERENPSLHSLRAVSRREAYQADIVYGTNSEFGFDYLRDNMVADLAQMVQRGLDYAIVDEVDNILIDEARTPLIISGPAQESTDLYATFARLVPRLSEDVDYVVEHKHKVVTLTEVGISRMEGWLNVGNLYDPANYHLTRFMENSLKAMVIYQRDTHYVVKDGEVVLVDEFTGRLMPGRRLSDGLHQAIEAKEGVPVQRETITYATITLQNYFRMYGKLAGMTGTAATEAEEFWKIYKLDVVVIPTHMPMIRQDHADLIYRTEEAKFRAVAKEIEERHHQGQPVLVGTTSIEKSERLSELLKRRGVPHQVLNAKHHEREAAIVAQAGHPGAVTVATNMAGRGTDIILGGNPQGLDLSPQEWERDHHRIVDLGGLLIIGTERHEARRVDNQLRGRSGRQGDPGSSRFYIGLEDELMRRFGGDRIRGFLEWAGVDEDTPLENRWVSRAVENAQVRVEAYHFDIRKRLVDYDDVINRHREVVYEERHKILSGADLKANIQDMIHQELDGILDTYLPGTEPEDWNVPAILADLGTIFPDLPPNLTESAIGSMARDEVAAAVHGHADSLYEQREQDMGAENTRVVERLVMLRVIDSLWVQHLTAVEQLRQSIGLHAAGQRDPLVMYKKVGHDYFQNLLARIQHDIVHTIYRVQLVSRTPTQAQQAQQAAQAQRAPVATASRETPITAVGAQHRSQAARATAPKVGRNDPCPCGSGKKYKKCHGQAA